MEGVILDELEPAIKRAAGSVAFQWPDVIEQDDLEQELWVWVLESPSVHRILERTSGQDRHNLIVRQAHNIAAKTRQKNFQFLAEFEYSIEDAKAVLEGTDKRHETLDDLEEAMDKLREKNPAQAEIIREKYGEKIPMVTRARQKMSERALQHVTNLMNEAYRNKASGFRLSQTVTLEEYREGNRPNTLGDGPGSRRVVSNATAQASLKESD